MILDFLNTPRPLDQLRAALEIIREFKNDHTLEEDLCCMLASWTKLEQLQEFLEYLVESTPLKDDTEEYMEAQRAQGWRQSERR